MFDNYRRQPLIEKDSDVLQDSQAGTSRASECWKVTSSHCHPPDILVKIIQGSKYWFRIPSARTVPTRCFVIKEGRRKRNWQSWIIYVLLFFPPFSEVTFYSVQYLRQWTLFREEINLFIFKFAIRFTYQSSIYHHSTHAIIDIFRI